MKPWLCFLCNIALIATVSAVTISIPECGPKFYCPDHCNISYVNKCPHNCNCKPVKFCPEVNCPAKGPGCIVITKLDGCQTCVCYQPVILIKPTALKGSEQTEFLFFDKKDFAGLVEAVNDTECTAEDKDQIDQCLLKIVNYKKFIKRRKNDAVATFNPLVQVHQTELDRMCTLHSDALTCVGKDLYERCRLVHFDLSQLDAFLGYPCGPKQLKFFQHYPCFQDAHRRSGRLQLCEDLLTASLLQISEIKTFLREKLRRKCNAIKWFVRCEKPNILRHCSKEAADVYTAAMKSAAEYIAPDCDEGFTHEAFITEEELSTPFSPETFDNVTDVLTTSSAEVNDTLLDLELEAILNATIFGEEFNATNSSTTKRIPKLYTRSPLITKLKNSSTVPPLQRTNFLQGEPFETLELLKKPEQVEKKEKKIRPLVFNWPSETQTTTTLTNNLTFFENASLENETQQVSAIISPVTVKEEGFKLNERISNFVYANGSLLPKETPTCPPEYQKIINDQFQNLFTEIREKSKTANLAQPLAYSFPKQVLKTRCSSYQNATANIPAKVKKVCSTNYEVYDQVVNAFSYPCGWGTETYFFKFYDCLTKVRSDPVVKQCEAEADEYLKDPSVQDQCEPYVLLSECTYDTIVRQCDYDGWEIEYQLMSNYVKNFVQNCAVTHIYRAI